MDALLATARALLDRIGELLAEFWAWTSALLAGLGFDPTMLLWIGVGLVVLWIITAVIYRITDFLVHLLLGAGLILLGVWALFTYLI